MATCSGIPFSLLLSSFLPFSGASPAMALACWPATCSGFPAAGPRRLCPRSLHCFPPAPVRRPRVQGCEGCPAWPVVRTCTLHALLLPWRSPFTCAPLPHPPRPLCFELARERQLPRRPVQATHAVAPGPGHPGARLGLKPGLRTLPPWPPISLCDPGGSGGDALARGHCRALQHYRVGSLAAEKSSRPGTSHLPA